MGTAMVVGLLALGGCTSDPGTEVATAARPTATPTPATGDQKEFEFVACMPSKGVSDMVDPIPGDTSGRSAVKYMLDVLGKGSDMAFQAALEQCQSLLPAPPAPTAPARDEAERSRQFAKCMRENGAPDFPDPDPSGKDAIVETTGVAAIWGMIRAGGYLFMYPNPALAPTLRTCQDLLPGISDIVDELTATAPPRTYRIRQ